MVTHALYDRIGQAYTVTRHPDPRIAAAILNALADAPSVLNVGAGAGAYEPAGRSTTSVELSAHMIRQRASGMSRAVQASAAALPFKTKTFGAAMAVLTLHHWSDWRSGIAEMRRVADRLVVFTFEPADIARFWLSESYFPEVGTFDRSRCPTVAEIAREVAPCRVEHVAVPHDCADGFLAAFWRRPEAYLNPDVRAGISALAQLDADVISRGVGCLRSDLESGAWEQRFGSLRSLDALDAGYRLVIA